MSQENVEAIRRSFELWLSGDLDAWLATVDPDVGWDLSAHPLPDVPNEGRGRDAFVEALATYMSGWNDFEAEVKDVIDAGEQVVAVIHETARMRGTDVLLDRNLIYLWSVAGRWAASTQRRRAKPASFETSFR